MNRSQFEEVSGCHSEPPLDQGSQARDAVEADGSAATAIPEADDLAWRDELSARLSSYRARRKVRPPRYPSLSLRFDPEPSSVPSHATPDGPVFEPISDHALALDKKMAEQTVQVESVGRPAVTEAAAVKPVPLPSAKIIEFPRSAWAPPLPPPDQLAEPVMERPRILEVPDVVPPPPALGGITIEAAQPPAVERRPGIDVPLQGASLGRRLVAGAVDGLIVAAATGVFGSIFWKIAGIRPPMIQMIGLAVGIPCLLWSAYQYLLLVYAGTTPGLRAAGLQLARFDGSRARRSQRRWRVLAGYLSAASLGMGYAWVFLDEDVLCWHDRITHTYLAPRT